jgi:hypothetical protein
VANAKTANKAATFDELIEMRRCRASMMHTDSNGQWDPQALGLVPMVVEQSEWRTRLRHLFAPAQGRVVFLGGP